MHSYIKLYGLHTQVVLQQCATVQDGQSSIIVRDHSYATLLDAEKAAPAETNRLGAVMGDNYYQFEQNIE